MAVNFDGGAAVDTTDTLGNFHLVIGRPPGSRVPVLLVPGYATNRSALWLICTFLAHRGWRWLWAVNNGPRSMPLAKQAERLAFCNRERQIGHSLDVAKALGKTMDLDHLIRFSVAWFGLTV